MARYRRRLTRDQKLVVSAVAAGLLMAASNSHGAATAGRAGNTLTARMVPAGSSYTAASWAAALLTAAGWPRTACNLSAVTAWEQAEGGNWANSARFNPLNTTQPEPGSYPVNSVGVQAYPSWRSGFAATLATLGNGHYPAILSALSGGTSAQAVADAVAASPWGTARFQANC
jgi:hypothetical protein